jgi:phospholipid/cholesterol/gamma-HCH transport system substrate-binding protein
VATVTPPRTPPAPPRERRPVPPTGTGRPRRPTVTGRPGGRARWLIPAILAVAAVIIVYLVLTAPSGEQYKLLFSSAELLVRGDQVQVGGVPVGTVNEITLTRDYKALVTIHVGSSLTPLHRGTSAEIRVPSLAGVANRYIALSPGPNNYPALPAGSVITSTTSPVDIDELFNTLNPATRRGLQQVIEGWALQYAGVEGDVNTSTQLFPPTLRALSHVFSELTRDEKTFTDFLVNAAEATTVIGTQSESLTNLIGNADTTFQAVGSEQRSLAEGLHELPTTLTQGTKTFTALGPPLAALRRLVEVSKPDTAMLPLLLERLRPLLNEANPVLRELTLAISAPGPDNDLTEAALALPALAKTLETASPHISRSLREGLPDSALFGPYSPDLQGFFRNFGQAAAYYDANGHYARTLPAFNDFKLGPNNTLTPVTPLQGLEGLTTRQLRRCPGAATQPAADGSSPFADGGLLGCNPGQVP